MSGISMDRLGVLLMVVVLVLGAEAFGQAGAGERAPITADDFEAGAYTTESGYAMKYRLFVPAPGEAPGEAPGVGAENDSSEVTGKRYPLVVFLHGKSRKGLDNRKQITFGSKLFARGDQQAKRACFVLAPQCPPNDGWGRPKGYAGYPETAPAEVLHEILDKIVAEYAVDVDRIYITGQSGGGGGTLHALQHGPKRFAAAAILCPGGRHTEEQMRKLAGVFGHVPMWFYHGAVDQVIDVEHTRLWVKVLAEEGVKAKYTEYPGVKHNVWESVYKGDGVGEWLFSHKRGE